jgi:hypothetical protein
MLHIKRQFLLFAVFATVVAPGLAVAAHSPTSDPLATEVVRVSEQETIERPIVVATTNIYNAQIVIQEGQEVTVLFELYNAEGVQSGVVYGIELYANDGSGRQLADSAVYNSKPVTLGSGETLPVAVTYVAPAFMSGAYEVWIMAKTQSGMPLALALAGEVTFVGKGGQIKVSDCIAEVDGTEYALTAGVDLARTESLSVTCLAENMFNEPTEVTPQFMNYERSVYGPVSETGVPITQSKLLPPNVKTKMTFLVPLASKPQAYDAVMKLVDRTTGAVVSSPVVIHYVIQGASATIHNVVFDKETYHTGDNAKAVVSWSLAADSFVNARGAGTAVGPLTLSVVMADAAGAFCSAPSVLSLQGASILSQLTIPVLRDCPSPQLVLSLADESGTAMTKQSFEYEPVVASEELKEPVTVASQFAMVASLVLLIVVLLVVAVKLLGFVRARVPAPTQLYEPINTTKKTEATISTLLGIVGFSLLFFGGFTPTTLAATLTVTSGFDTVTFAVNLNKATYLVNEQVQVSGAAFVTGCGNAITAGGLEATDGQGVVQSIGIFNMDPYSNPGGFAMFDKNIAGYSSPGVKLMPIRAYVTVSNVLNSAFGNLPLTVVCPDGSTGDGSQCVSNSPVPIGTIAGSGCTISAGDNTCVGTISWNAEHTTAPTVRNVTTNTIYSYNANGVNEQRTISHGVNVIAIYDQANLLDNQAIIGACEGGSSWNGSLCEAAAQPTATISATSCTIDEGDSSCATALTWHIQSATTPNVKDGTIGVVLSTDTSGTAVPFTITHGSHEMQVRDGVAVLDSAQATASCQTGTNWDGTKCVSSVIGGSITVSLTANGDDIGTNIIVGEDIQLGWVVTGTPDHCVASDDWSGSEGNRWW